MKKTYFQKEHIQNLTVEQIKSKYVQIGEELKNKDAESPIDLGSATLEEQAQEYVSIIKKFFYVFDELKDPLLILTPIYLKSNKRSVELIDIFSHPLYGLFIINIEDTPTNNLQSFNITINTTVLSKFLTDYVFYSSTTTESIEDKTNLYKYLFVIAAKQLIDETATQQYKHHSINTPATKNLSILNNENLFYDLSSQYNFYIKKYEDTFSSGSNIKEDIIPNYYALDSYLNTDETKAIQSIVSLNDRVDVTEQTVLSNQYFSDYVEAIREAKTAEERQSLRGVKNYILDSYFANNLNLSLSSENFPYTAKLTFSNYPSDGLIELIQNKKLDTLVTNNIHYIFYGGNANISTDNPFLVQSEVVVKKPSEEGEYTDYDGQQYELSIKTKTVEETVESSTKIDYLYSPDPSTTQGFGVADNIATFSFYLNENRKYLNALSKPLGVFSYIALRSKIKQICSKSLNYKNVLNFTELDVYPLCFQIEKTFGVRNQTQVNNISIARNMNNSEISLQDTQLYYEKEYNYKVYSMNLVNSFKYFFQDVSYNILNNKIEGVISLESDCNIYKELVLNKKFEVIDNPPTAIDVAIVPFISIPNNMLFLLNTQSTSYFEIPKIVEQKDVIFFNKIRKKQNLNSRKVLFETVDDLNGVQVFRTNVAPKRYSDFANQFYRFIPIKNNIRTSNSFVDVLQQNTKYYYIFRSIDIHNNISNPTAVFEVEIKNNDGAIYPIVQTYNMKENDDFNYTKSFKKYLSINPSVLYTAFDKQEDGSVIVGQKSGLWDQQFKVRITSKKSGKKFDVNLTFNKNEKNFIDNTNNLNSDLKFDLATLPGLSLTELE